MILRGSGMGLLRRLIGVEVYAGMSNIYVLILLFETVVLERAPSGYSVKLLVLVGCAVPLRLKIP